MGAEGGDTEERNETVLIAETYELRKKKDELKSHNCHLHFSNSITESFIFNHFGGHHESFSPADPVTG